MSEETKSLLSNQIKKIIILYILLAGIPYFNSLNSNGIYIILKVFAIAISGIASIAISCSLFISLTPELFHFLLWLISYPFKRIPYTSNARLKALKKEAQTEQRKKQKDEELQNHLHEAEIHLKEAMLLSVEEAYRLGIKDGYEKGKKIGYKIGYWAGLESGKISERKRLGNS